MSDDRLFESAWARGWADTKHGIGDWRFWLAELVGGGAVGIYYGPLHAITFVLGVAFCLLIWATATAPLRQRNEARKFINALQSTPALSIVFPPEANLPDKVSRFRDITKFLHQDVYPHPHHHKFFVAVVNNTGRTIRNVGIRVIFENMPPRPLRLDLITENAKAITIDIQPGSSELFRLGAVMRLGENKIVDRHEVVDAEKMAQVAELARLHEKNRIGLVVRHAQGTKELLRNNGKKLYVMAHGDDVDPVYAEIELNMKDDISVAIRSVEPLDIKSMTAERFKILHKC